MGENKRFLKASSHYLLTQLAILAASLISFPIIARVLSVEEYGVLSLCNTILLFGVALSKLGLQNSIVRFYPEYRQQGKVPVFFRTYAVVCVVAGLVFFGVTGGLTGWVLADEVAGIAWLVAGVVLLQTLFGYLTNFLRSQEKTKIFALFNVVVRYLSVFGGLALIFLLNNGITCLFQAQVFAYGLLVVGLVFFLHKDFQGVGPFFSKELLHDSLKFGLPLIAFEISSIALAFSDRFLITHFNGLKELGIYAVVYTLCMYIADLIRQPISMAVGPMYNRIFAQQGEGEARKFLGNLGSIVYLFAFPVFAGVMGIREDLLAFLASEKYVAGAEMIPWILGGLLVYSSQPVVAAGLYLKKKTPVVAKISLLCGILNIAANAFLLPRFGVIAAAWSTAGCYLAAVTCMALLSSRELRIPWHWSEIRRYALCALALYIVIVALPADLHLVFKVVSGLVFYPMAILMVDGGLRSQLKLHFEGR